MHGHLEQGGAPANQRLLREAEAAERLALVVSYVPDKKRLMQQAQKLRAKAAAPAERRSWLAD
jgi:hypothetical protein